MRRSLACGLLLGCWGGVSASEPVGSRVDVVIASTSALTEPIWMPSGSAGRGSNSLSGSAPAGVVAASASSAADRGAVSSPREGSPSLAIPFRIEIPPLPEESPLPPQAAGSMPLVTPTAPAWESSPSTGLLPKRAVEGPAVLEEPRGEPLPRMKFDLPRVPVGDVSRLRGEGGVGGESAFVGGGSGEALPPPRQAGGDSVSGQSLASGEGLPPAPLELLYSAGPGVPVHHGTFGSPPIRLSRDYPSLLEIPHLLHGQMMGDEAVPGPATDWAYLQVEYLLWFTNRDRIPVLGTTSLDGGEGYLNQPGTVALIGPGPYGPTTRSGLRVRGGAWLDDCGACGIDGSIFVLGRQSDSLSIGSAQFPIITRPIFAVNNGGFFFGEIVARPNIALGVLTVENDSLLWGADANIRKAICRLCDRQRECFLGFRYLNLTESIAITEQLISLPGSPNPPGTNIVVQDKFRTRNDFYGGQVGYAWWRRWGQFDLSARGSIALGVTRQQVQIDGFQIVSPPGRPSERFVGGLLATPTNIGTHVREAFSAVPELTLNAGLWLTPMLRIYAGYNFLYWPSVVRPGREIDLLVNVSQVPNPPTNVPFSDIPRPAVLFNDTDLFLHGVQFGVEVRW